MHFKFESGEYKVIVTNKKGLAANVVKYHEGRGSQEKIFGEGKGQLNIGYIPVRKRAGNEAYLLCGVMAHNLGRELQMQSRPPERKTTSQRKALWVFEEMKTIRQKILRTAGRLTRPQGKLTLTLPKNKALEQAIGKFLPA